MTRHLSPRSVAIVLVETLWILLSLTALFTAERSWQHASLSLAQLAQQVGFAALLYLLSFYYCDLYNFEQLQVRRDLITAAVRTFSVLAIVFGALFLFTHWLAFSSDLILLHLTVTTAFVLAVRTHIDGVLVRFGLTTRVAVVGTGPEARRLAEEILRRAELAQEVSCFVGPLDGGTIPLRARAATLSPVPVIAPRELLAFASAHGVKRILVATADLGDGLPVDDLLSCKAQGFEVLDGHTFYERLLGRIFLTDLSPRWLIFSEGFVRSRPTLIFKRLIDLIVASLVLVLTAPLVLLVAVAIKLGDGGPILFRQTRVGAGGALFNLYKFRSMRIDAEKESGPKWAEVDDPRVTRLGRWIRSLRIDEIPQAWNVLRGDMSFVGPRPERPEFVAMLQSVIPFYDYRHAVRPGITGWAQVNYPYGATVEDARHKLEYDLYYVKNMSGLMDLFILFRTVKIILFGWGSR